MHEQEYAIHHASGTVMGGPWQLRHVPQPEIEPERVAAAALDALQAVDRHMSHYKIDSDLMRLNVTPVGEWLPVTADLVTVMAAADEYRSFTNGALDIALGQAINAWGFGPEPIIPQHRPNIAAYVRQLTTQKDYQWQYSPPAIRRISNVTFNLAALAKGFAVDCAADAVRALGIENFLIEAAGEIYAQGERPGGRAWQVGLELPIPGRFLVYGQIPLQGWAIATSGGYRKYHHIDDATVIHTLNPQTALPVEGDLLAVSVMDQQCMRADALATALFVQGGAQGSAFADKHHIAAMFLLRSEEGICEIRSRAWMAYLHQFSRAGDNYS